MTKDRIYAYARRLQGMVKRVREMEANLDDGEGYKALVADADPAKALELAKAITVGREGLASWEAAVLQEAKRDSIASAEELLTDITAALTQAERCFDAWREAKQSYELERATASPNAEALAAWNAKLTTLHDTYDAAVQLASALVPTSGVIQL